MLNKNDCYMKLLFVIHSCSCRKMMFKIRDFTTNFIRYFHYNFTQISTIFFYVTVTKERYGLL